MLLSDFKEPLHTRLIELKGNFETLYTFISRNTRQRQAERISAAIKNLKDELASYMSLLEELASIRIEITSELFTSDEDPLLVYVNDTIKKTFTHLAEIGVTSKCIVEHCKNKTNSQNLTKAREQLLEELTNQLYIISPQVVEISENQKQQIKKEPTLPPTLPIQHTDPNVMLVQMISHMASNRENNDYYTSKTLKYHLEAKTPRNHQWLDILIELNINSKNFNETKRNELIKSAYTLFFPLLKKEYEEKFEAWTIENVPTILLEIINNNKNLKDYYAKKSNEKKAELELEDFLTNTRNQNKNPGPVLSRNSVTDTSVNQIQLTTFSNGILSGFSEKDQITYSILQGALSTATMKVTSHALDSRDKLWIDTFVEAEFNRGHPEKCAQLLVEADKQLKSIIGLLPAGNNVQNSYHKLTKLHESNHQTTPVKTAPTPVAAIAGTTRIVTAKLSAPPKPPAATKASSLPPMPPKPPATTRFSTPPMPPKAPTPPVAPKPHDHARVAEMLGKQQSETFQKVDLQQQDHTQESVKVQAPARAVSS